MKKIEDILITNLDALFFNLSVKNNTELVTEFKDDFLVINDYKPITEMDKLHILEYSKTYIDEFKRRIEQDSAVQVIEFAKLLQELMKNDTTTDDSFYTRSLVRLYSFAIRKMEQSGITKPFLKKEFL